MKILVTTDGSECSSEAIERALGLLDLDGAEAVVVSVAPTPVPSDIPSMVGAPYVDYSLLLDEIQRETRRHADTAVALLEARGLTVRSVIEQGDAAAKILEIAHNERPDVIVIGSHGKSGFRRLLLGSVSQKIVTGAACPVLVVRTQASLGSKGV